MNFSLCRTSWILRGAFRSSLLPPGEGLVVFLEDTAGVPPDMILGAEMKMKDITTICLL